MLTQATNPREAGAAPAKLCPSCQTVKPAGEFYRNSKLKDGLYVYCKKCSNVRSASWKKRHPDAVRAMRVRSLERNPHKGRRDQLKSVYGLTVEAYEAMLQSQGGKCAIRSCGRDIFSRFANVTGKNDVLIACVDHDHSTRRVRGLLCNRCNYVVGCVEKHGQIVAGAHDYLRVKSC